MFIIKNGIIRISFLFTLSFFYSALINAAQCQPSLSLEVYLNQVRHNNLAHAGSCLTASGAKERQGEGKLIMKPSLFAEGQYLKDNYDPDWSPIAGDSRSLQSYKVGISQNTPFGLQGKLYYNYQHQTLHGLSPLVNQTQLTASSPIAELNLPLSRNWAGRETRATAQLIDSQAKLTQHSECYKNQMLLAQAESAYWRLAVTRMIVMKQKESLDRAIKIQKWVTTRMGLRLAEESDLLQATAAVEGKHLDIQSAINDQILAERDFNTFRGLDQERVVEWLSSFSECMTSHLVLPCEAGVREDVRAAEQEQKIKIATAKLGIEKNKPDLDLYVSYAFNGNNPSTNAAIAESFSSNYPSTAVGLRLTMPLDFCRLAKDRCAYHKEIRGAKYQFQQKIYDNRRQWENLVVKIENAKRRFDVTKKLESIQLKKLITERDRLKYGKTTTYQVLLFEQDYANTQIASFVIQDEILELMAQLKTFGVV